MKKYQCVRKGLNKEECSVLLLGDIYEGATVLTANHRFDFCKRSRKQKGAIERGLYIPGIDHLFNLKWFKEVL